MKKTHSYKSYVCMFSVRLVLLGLLVNGQSAFAQEKRALNGELATCQVKLEAQALPATKARSVAARTVQVAPNQLGYFDYVTNIAPAATMAVEVAYPQGREGEQVAVLVQDGGVLGNGQAMQVVKLDKDKKIAFRFQAANSPGIYRVMLRKRQDVKVMQLWVGAEPVAVKR